MTNQKPPCAYKAAQTRIRASNEAIRLLTRKTTMTQITREQLIEINCMFPYTEEGRAAAEAWLKNLQEGN